MTRSTDARIAGITFFVYLAAGIGSMAMELTLAVWLLLKGVAMPAPRLLERF